jgi:agmatine deiminase
MPAEWEPHAATWLAWPHSAETWPGRLERMPRVWAEIVRALSPGEEIHILVNDGAMEASARCMLKEHRADAPNVHFHQIPTDDAWLRDSGPIFVRDPETGESGVLDWEFNAWGGKYPPFDCDNGVAFRSRRRGLCSRGDRSTSTGRGCF